MKWACFPPLFAVVNICFESVCIFVLKDSLDDRSLYHRRPSCNIKFGFVDGWNVPNRINSDRFSVNVAHRLPLYMRNARETTHSNSFKCIIVISDARRLKSSNANDVGISDVEKKTDEKKSKQRKTYELD